VIPITTFLNEHFASVKVHSPLSADLARPSRVHAL
jgi:hypothetical protein